MATTVQTIILAKSHPVARAIAQKRKLRPLSWHWVADPDRLRGLSRVTFLVHASADLLPDAAKIRQVMMGLQDCTVEYLGNEA